MNKLEILKELCPTYQEYPHNITVFQFNRFKANYFRDSGNIYIIRNEYILTYIEDNHLNLHIL